MGLSEWPRSGTPGDSPKLWSDRSFPAASCGWAVGWEGQLLCCGHVLAPRLVFLSGGRRLGTAASTANLLDDVEGHSCGKKRHAMPCHATLCRVLCSARLAEVPRCPAPSCPTPSPCLGMAPIRSMPGHGHLWSRLAPGPTRLSWVTGDGISSSGEPRGLAAGMCSPAGCVVWGWGTVPANLSSARFALRLVLAVGFVAAWTTLGLAQERPRGRNAPMGQNFLPVLSGVFWQRVPASQSLGIVCLGEEIPAPGQGLGCLPAGAPCWGWNCDTGRVPSWKRLHPLTAPACLCLSDEDFQARKQQLREEEETPKEGQ